ncbi:MAG: glycerol-3-phosphate 1-O-acyltransferase PlsY [Anaerolineales bacterium]|nr:glycerol-3-phosphate 1-O-acyltransferase PlsY [Anaerolineales bacterium]MCB9126561.1 glycerol-3-phosphate 1-O-acyltransferase PlsY [Ardenticatenales bacterium]MCB9172513.1 glycerol-3-phosphate 1-O-acyltransferase PlsY [Ardenticatenales bacterium]
MIYLFAVLLGYLLGSIPTGFVAARQMAGVDVRTIGSGRTGGTNVLRSAGKNAAIVTVVGDLLKGVVAVLLAKMLWADPMATALAAIFVAIGHNHSIFLKFKGGAGTMTGAGVMGALDPMVLLFTAILPVTFLWVTKMSSVASLLLSSVGLLVATLLVWQNYLPWQYLIFFLPFFLMSWETHRPNIQRLRAGTERRIGEKAA